MTVGHQCNKCKRFFGLKTYTTVDDIAKSGTIIDMNPRVVGYPPEKTYCVTCSIKLMPLLDKFDDADDLADVKFWPGPDRKAAE